MTKQELLEFAKQLGVSPANNDMTKEELRAGIDAKLGKPRWRTRPLPSSNRCWRNQR